MASFVDAVRVCEQAASRVNPSSPSRRELRRLLRWHELDLAQVVLLVDSIARLDLDTQAPDVRPLVRAARHAIAPLWENV